MSDACRPMLLAVFRCGAFVTLELNDFGERTKVCDIASALYKTVKQQRPDLLENGVSIFVQQACANCGTCDVIVEYVWNGDDEEDFVAVVAEKMEAHYSMILAATYLCELAHSLAHHHFSLN